MKAAKGKMRKHPERDLQKACVRWFECVPEYKKYSPLFFHNAAGEARTKKTAALLQLLGVKPGISDLILLVPSQGFPFLCMELKSETGKLSKHQVDFMNAVKSVGGYYTVLRSVDEFMQTVKGYLANPLHCIVAR